MSSHPRAPTGSIPLYSNAGFQVIGHVIEALAGQSYESVLSRDLIKPLGLNRFSYSAPKSSEGIVPNKRDWAYDAGDSTP